MRGIQRQLTAIQRRRRWKICLRVAGIMLVAVGVVLLPFPHLGFAKRDLSGFSAIADTGEFAASALVCIVTGSLIVVASFLIRGDMQE
jgi:L-asparagine transporter-like permease